MSCKKILPYFRLMRFDKPIGFFLLLWPTLIALWLAGKGNPNPKIVSIFILGVLVMRSVGCSINDLADRKFDGFVTRTQDRPIVSGAISPRSAVLLIIILLILAFLLVLQLNFFTFQLSLIALFITFFYPLMKRYTHFPQVVLGAAFGMAVPMSFAAITNTIPNSAWILYFAVLLWTVAFDTEYAMKDRTEDIKLGLKSTAIFFGKWDRLMIGLLQIMTLALMALLGSQCKLKGIYFLGILISIVFIVYQHYLLKDRDPNLCFKAFLNNHYLGAWWFGIVLLDYIIM